MNNLCSDSGWQRSALLIVISIIVNSIIVILPGLAADSSSLSTNALKFIENKGQWTSAVRFMAKGPGVDVWISDSELVYDFYRVESLNDDRAKDLIAVEDPNELTNPDSLRRSGHVLRMRFENSGRDRMHKKRQKKVTRASGRYRAHCYHNYIRAGKRNARYSHVPLYQEAILENVYAGIDARLYFDQANIRYDLIVHPGANPRDIKIKLDAAEGLKLNKKGEIEIETRLGKIYQRKLFAFQKRNGKREEVVSRFYLDSANTIRFDIAAYDSSKTLIIDPLFFSTFVGGSNADSHNDIEVDYSGHPFICGYTTSSNFPATIGAYDQSLSGSSDLFVGKLSPTGDDLLFASYIGGGDDDRAYGLAVDFDSDVYLTGYTKSSDFPTTVSAFDRSYNGGAYDAFALKLSADGSSLIYSTLLGGAAHELGWEVVVDNAENAYIGGVTASSAYPTTTGAFDESYNGDNEVFVTKVNPQGSALVYSTFIGGSGKDRGYQLQIDASSEVTITGFTESNDYPTTTGAYDESHNGGKDGFASKLNFLGNGLVYSTFFGGSGDDRGYGISFGTGSAPFITGYTSSVDFPVSTNALITTNQGNGDAHIISFDFHGTTANYATYVGDSAEESGWDIAVNSDGQATITGYTFSGNFPTSVNAFDDTHNGNSDAFLFKTNSLGSTMLYSSFIGGANDDTGNGVILDIYFGKLIVAGTTESSDYPTTQGAYDRQLN